MKDDILMKVFRSKESYNYKYDEKKNDYRNNIKNNCLDRIVIFRASVIILTVNKVQTVSNHPYYDHKDTLKAGPFKIKCFVDPRSFHGQIHGIIDGMDIENQKIDEYSMQIEDGYQKGRWLFHDKWSFNKNRDLYNAYSGGCFITDSLRLNRFNNFLNDLGFKPGDEIKGILEEV